MKTLSLTLRVPKGMEDLPQRQAHQPRRHLPKAAHLWSQPCTLTLRVPKGMVTSPSARPNSRGVTILDRAVTSTARSRSGQAACKPASHQGTAAADTVRSQRQQGLQLGYGEFVSRRIRQGEAVHQPQTCIAPGIMRCLHLSYCASLGRPNCMARVRPG